MASSPEFAILLGLGVGKPASVPVAALSKFVGSVVASIGLRSAPRKFANWSKRHAPEAGIQGNREI